MQSFGSVKLWILFLPKNEPAQLLNPNRHQDVSETFLEEKHRQFG